ncbi:MAG TPA: Crp/Fnr family transcriptional regulator [Mucilaginibacter sp.]|jgi:CRP/FNR family transcriptional regulator|nr:Crp/Fnr family transcriptional regulator [Mucilaginibacter sp.]
MVKNECDLKSCFLCRFCLPDWLPAVAANRKNITVKKGQALFSEGDPVTGIYFIYSGIVKVHKRWGEDKELILRFAKQGDIVGHMALGKDTAYPVSATAVEAGTICYVAIDFFESTLNINHKLARQLISVLASDLQESEKRMRNLAHMPVKGRVAQALLTLRGQFGTTPDGFINIELSRQDLSSFTGAAYESLFRVLNELVEENSICIKGKSISIASEPGLMKLASETELS